MGVAQGAKFPGQKQKIGRNLQRPLPDYKKLEIMELFV